MYKEANIDISRETALLMISWILSDTLYFRSPTTTEEDKKILTELNKIVNIENLEQFAMNMFTAKSDLWNISPYQLVKEIDAKDFIFGWKRSLIACIETTNPQYCLDRKHEIIDEIQIIKQSEWYDFILFCIVDILQEKNTAIIASPIEMEIVKKVFDSETMDWIADLWNRISRKKTIVPPMESVLW
jgi:manganese-dependent inorganic pyrophosphatase